MRFVMRSLRTSFSYVVFMLFFVSMCFFMRVFFRAFFKMRLMRTGISLAPFSAN